MFNIIFVAIILFMKKFLCLMLSLCFLCFTFVFTGCALQENSAEIEATLESSALAQEQIIISASKSAKMLSFDENLPEIFDFLGNAPYKTYTITLFGVVYKDAIKNKLVAIKEDGTHFQPTESTDLINGYIDYFTLKIKLLSNETSIKLSPTAVPQPLNKLRIIDGYYYLNLVWLNLDKTKTTFSLKEYQPENYIYIETLSPAQKTIQKLLIKLVYDITFI